MSDKRSESIDGLLHLFRQTYNREIDPEKALELFLRCYGGTELYIPVYGVGGKKKRLERYLRSGMSCREAAERAGTHLTWAYKVFYKIKKEVK